MTEQTARVHELRVALTVPDVDAAVAFFRDQLGMPQVADWSTQDGRCIVLGAARATLEIFDEAQAEFVDQTEVGRRVSGPVRLAMQVDDTDEATSAVAAAGATVDARL